MNFAFNPQRAMDHSHDPHTRTHIELAGRLVLPHDAVLARYMPWPGVRLYFCLSLSVCHVVCRNGRTNRAGFWCGGFLRPILHCVKRKSVTSKNKGTFLRNFVPNSGLRKFCHDCQQSSSTVELVDHTYDGRRVIAGRTLFNTRRSTVTL